MSRIHQIEVTIGPLAEHEGRGNSNEAFRIVSSGRTNDLRVQFATRRTFGGAPNRSEVVLTNLSESSRNRFRQRLTRVEVSAGYLTGDRAGLRKVASGALTSATAVDSIPEIETTIAFLDGFGGMSRGVFRKSFGPGVPLSTVIGEVAASMPGVTVARATLSIGGKLGASGRTFAGRAADILDDLAAQWGFSWSVESRINSTLNGVYTVQEHDLAGNSHGNPWTSTIRSLSF